MSVKIPQRSRFGFFRNVIAAGWVSFFMDVSSEMIYPLVPLFLSEVLGGSMAIVGLVEGAAESTASLLKVVSGRISDRMGKRKSLMALGYGISTFSRPLLVLAAGWPMVFGARFMDRLGKGVRTAPRDALLAESAPPFMLGRAFGYHRALDTLGAVVGPAVAWFLQSSLSVGYRTIFLLSILPALLALGTIFRRIEETGTGRIREGKYPPSSFRRLDGRFYGFLFISALFALGNSSNVFLLLKARQLGMATSTIPLIYLLLNGVYALSSYPAGVLADRFGKKRMILLGFLLFSLLYYGFAKVTLPWELWVLFLGYGLYQGLTEGVQRAFLAEIVPSDGKATAFGIYHGVIGMALFPASLIGGWLWDRFTPSATFYFGMVTGAISFFLFIGYVVCMQREYV